MSYEIPYDWKFNANFSDVNIIPGLATSSGSNSFSGNIDSALVTDPTSNSSVDLSIALADINKNVVRYGGSDNMILVTEDSNDYISFGYSEVAGQMPPTTSMLTLEPDSIKLNPVSSTNTNYTVFNLSNESSSAGLSCSVNYGSNVSSVSIGDTSVSLSLSDGGSLYGSIELNSSGVFLYTNEYLMLKTGSLPSTYETDSSVSAGYMIFDDTDGIIYRCTNSTSSTSGTTNTWNTFYSTPSVPLYMGNNYIKSADNAYLLFSANGLESDDPTSYITISNEGIYVNATSSTSAYYFNDSMSISGTDGETSGSISMSVPNGLSATATNGSNSYNFSVNSNSILLTNTSSGNEATMSMTGGQFNLNVQSSTISSTESILISSSTSAIISSNLVTISSNNGLSIYGVSPSSSTDTTTSGTFAPDNNCIYVKGSSSWSRLSEDPDWQIGMVPYVSTASATETSGTAGTTSIATESTNGYYIVNAKVVGKCSTSGLSCFAIFENYGTCFDGTNLTLSEGESIIHTFGSMSAYNVDMTVSGKNIVFTYNVTTSASTSWTWNIVVQQKFVTAY